MTLSKIISLELLYPKRQVKLFMGVSVDHNLVL